MHHAQPKCQMGTPVHVPHQKCSDAGLGPRPVIDLRTCQVRMRKLIHHLDQDGQRAAERISLHHRDYYASGVAD